MFCSNCGAPANENCQFCDQCGKPLELLAVPDPEVQEPDTTEIASEPKKRRLKWLWIAGGAVALAVLVLLGVFAAKQKKEEEQTAPATKLGGRVLDYKTLHIEIGRQYSFEELLQYDMDLDPFDAEEGRFWTILSGHGSNHTDSVYFDRIVFGIGPTLLYHPSYVYFMYPIMDEAPIGQSGEDTDDAGNTVSPDGWDEDNWKYKYAVRKIEIRTEGISFAGITVGDDLEDVLELYPMASCTSSAFMRSNKVNEGYSSVWQIYTDEDGNFIDFTDYFEETRLFNSRPDLWSEYVTGDTMLNVAIYVDEDGSVRMITVRVHDYERGPFSAR